MWNTNPDSARLRNVSTARSINGAIAIEQRQRYSWSDERLMEAVAARDDLAFAVIYDRYSAVVYSTAFRVLGDVQLAEDATQDIFVRLWRAPGRFEPARGRFITWLLSVVRNRAVDELRARGRRRRREGLQMDPESDFLETIPGDSDDPVSSVQLHERQELVRCALASLPREQRLALELSYFSGFTQQQIADALHEPLGTVKTRIRLGMQKLRRALDGQV
jgi:RNA polymerase sigma-70 factor (ECF subfamily)